MTQKEPYDDSRYCLRPMGSDYTEIIHERGSTIFSFDPKSRWFTINSFDVDKDWRGEGIGQNMLRYSKDLAGQVGARFIIAAIISRESLDAMAAVFGEDAITIGHRGEYAPPGVDRPIREEDMTSAVLWYEVTSGEIKNT